MGLGDTLGVSGAVQALKDASGLSSLLGKNKKSALPLPWSESGISPSKSKFFLPIQIDDSRWDKLYPYRLIVIDTTKKNSVVGGNPATSVSVNADKGTPNSIVLFEQIGKKWIFKLPITPQQLSIADQYAINTSATLRGILEEHGGIKFKFINASGTMGIWPYRDSLSKPPSSPGILQSVFGGTIQALGNVVNQVSKVINAATSNHPANKPTTIKPEASSAGPASTGYYQALALQQFLEQYAEAKKDPKNKGWRLVFDIPKQNQSYIVTPMQFVWQQTVAKPTHINYTFQLKAWRRVDLQFSAIAAQTDVQKISPGILQRVMSTLNQARNTASSITSLIGAVRSDVEAPLEVLRQTALFIKDLAGITITVADLPKQIQKDYASSIKESINILKDAITSTTSNKVVLNAVTAIAASTALSEGLSLARVSQGQLGNDAIIRQLIDPANNIFKEPEKYFALMDQVPVSSLNLSDVQQLKVDEIIDDARQTTIDDLKKFRNVILDLTTQLSNNFGAGSAFYNQLYGKPAPTVRIQPMTLDEYDILKIFYDVLQSYDILTATTELDDSKKQTNMEYVAGLSDQADISFQTSTSKILSPVPFGLTMEAIALRYLGDAQRWLEIVTLNNLREPYIDEDGFQLILLSNATGRQITVNSAENLFVGQRVILKSSTQTPSPRKILDIDKLSEVSFLLTLDGESDLDNFITADSAYIQVYLPGTVNSQQKIFIPSDIPVSDDPNIIPPTLTTSDPLTALSKVDLLLTDEGDIAINNFGDFRVAYGLTNIIQALRIKIGTPKGKLLTHPEFGLGIKAGVISSDIQIQDIYDSLNNMIKEDPRFQGVSTLQISLDGPVLTINMGVVLVGQQGVFPIVFQLAA